MDRVSVDGGELEVEIAGTGEPVVLIHGAMIADAFGPLLAEPRLTNRYRLVLYHRRGYAGSSPGPGGVDADAADCRALLRQLGIERAHVVGHSYGGDVALQLALEAPAVVHTLAVLEPALILGASGPGYRAALEGAGERYRMEGAEATIDAAIDSRWPGYRPVLDRLLPGAFEQAVADAPFEFDHNTPGMLAWTFGEFKARRITQPTLSVLGGNSPSRSPRFAEVHRLLLEWVPNVEEAVVPGVTHMMQIEDPRGTAEALAAFWAEHPLATAPSARSTPGSGRSP